MYGFYPVCTVEFLQTKISETCDVDVNLMKKGLMQRTMDRYALNSVGVINTQVLFKIRSLLI